MMSYVFVLGCDYKALFATILLLVPVRNIADIWPPLLLPPTL